MPTFDQLPPEQQAIIELVVRRGRSYDALSDALAIPAARVRELAREALTDLAPVTAERVDPDRRAQIADYVLRQQAGAEGTATHAHLRRSEAARAWTLSLLDSLADMYEDGARPEAPAAAAVEEAPRERERARPRERVRERAERPRRRVREPKPEPPAREPLSPEAWAAVRRRRLIAGALGLVALAGVVVGIIALTSGGSGKKSTATKNTATQLIGEQLQPVAGAKAQGLAVIAQRGNQRIVVVQAKLPPTKSGQAYEVWLYNSPADAQALGAQVTDKQGNYQGQGPLPASASRFRYIDVSLQTIPNAACQRSPACLRKSAQHNGHSVLRGLLSAMRPINPNAASGAGGAGAGTGGATGGTGGTGGTGATGGAGGTP
ncbi:MAG: hypothetical protein JOZ25_05000 [Actinobacteria bacterium]|nr:hypothetical protein [Actinomycetota bacterium]